MKKLLAMVLAFVMVLSLVPMIDLTAKAAADKDLHKGSDVGDDITIDITEISHGPYYSGKTVEYSVVFTNTGDAIKGSGSQTLKIHIYNTNSNLNNVFDDVTLPDNNLQYRFAGHTESECFGNIKNDKYNQLEFELNGDVLFPANGSITLTLQYKVRDNDKDLHKNLENFIIIYLGDTEKENAVGKFVTSSFDQVVSEKEKGELTVTNTVTKDDAPDNDTEFSYTLTLEDKSFNEKVDDLQFTNGQATFRLKNEGKRTISLPVGTDFTLTETPNGEFVIENTTTGGTHIDDRTVTGKISSSPITVGFTNTLTSAPVEPGEPAHTYKYKVVYHANLPTGVESQYPDIKDYEDKNDSGFFVVKEICEGGETKNTTDDDIPLFTDSNSKPIKWSVEDGSGTTWYFEGWHTSESVAEGDSIEYSVSDFSGNKRGFVKDDTSRELTLDTKTVSQDLYAIWSKTPGRIGYTMQVEGGRFKDSGKTSDGQLLGDNGTTGSNAKKFIVNDGGHSNGATVTATQEIPTSSDWSFVIWMNKKANTDGDSNTKYLVGPGKEFSFGTTSTNYSLDAIWSKITGTNDEEYIYDGKSHNIDISKVSVEFNNPSTSSSYDDNAKAAYDNLFAKDNIITYDVSVYDVQKDEESDTIIGYEPGDAVPAELQYTEPGTYIYKIGARLNSSYGSDSINQTLGYVYATLTILDTSLTVTKNVPNVIDDTTGFDFKIAFDGWEPADLKFKDGTPVTKDSSSGAFSFTLQDGKSVTIISIPVGVSYTVTETDKTNYIELTAEQKGTITGADKDQQVTFTNYKTASLTVKKEVKTDGGTLPSSENEKVFNFTLSLSLPAGMPDQTIEGQTVKSGETTDISFALKAGETKEFTGIPFGSTYSVKEKLEGTDEHFYTQAFTSDHGTIGETIDSESETITCTNTYHENASDTGRLRITKYAAGMASLTEFKVKVTYEYNGDPAHIELYNSFKTAEGITSGDSQTYTIPRNGSILIKNIPYGTKYTIEEVFDAGSTKPRNMLITVPDGEAGEYEISGTGTSAKVSGAILEKDEGAEGYDFDSVTLTNRYLGDLTIKKEVDGDYKPETWEVELTLKFSGFDKSELGLLENAMRITDANGERTAAELMEDFRVDDAVTVTLTNEKPEAVVYDVPIERTSYVISEDSEFAGDTVKIQVGTGAEKEASQTDPTVFTNETANVVFKNSYTEEPPAPPTIYPPIENPASTLTVTKRVDGEGADTEQEFDFTVKNSSGVEIASFKLKNGGTRSVSVTPGAEYTVTEEYVSGYTPKWNGEVNGSVYTFTAKSGVNRAECVNTYKRPYTVPDVLDADSHYAYAVGDTFGLILPNSTVTRKEVVAILFRLLKEDVRMENWSQESPFADVPNDAWYSSAVGTLYNLGYLHGTGGGKFEPDLPMTRAEITALRPTGICPLTTWTGTPGTPTT